MDIEGDVASTNCFGYRDSGSSSRRVIAMIADVSVVVFVLMYIMFHG